MRNLWPAAFAALVAIAVAGCGSAPATRSPSPTDTPAPPVVIPSSAHWGTPTDLGTAPVCSDEMRGDDVAHVITGERRMHVHVGANANGQALAAWGQCDAAGVSGLQGAPIPNSVWSAHFDGRAWAPSLRVGAAIAQPVEVFRGPQVGELPLALVSLDHDDRGLAFWSGVPQAAYAALVPATGWAAPQTFPTFVGAQARLQASPRGQPFLVWRDTSGSSDRLKIAAFGAETGWGAVNSLDVPPASGLTPDVPFAVDASGNVIAAWVQGETLESTEVWGAQVTASGQWQPHLLQASHGSDYVRSVDDVAVNAHGDGVAVWVFGGHGAAARFRAASGWEAPVFIYVGDGVVSHPRVALDDSGDALLVWTVGVPCGVVYGMRWNASGGFDGTARLSVLPPAYSAPGQFGCEPVVVGDSAGNGVAAWADDTFGEAPLALRAARYRAGRGWEALERIDGGQGTAGPYLPPHDLALDGHGGVTAVWMGHDATAWKIRANRLAAD